MLACMGRAGIHWISLAVIAVAACPACSGISGLDAAPGADSALSAGEQSAVRRQVAQAVEAKRWKIAWNQEIEAGADREALEEIALSALRDDSRHAEDMLDALRGRWGALREPGRARVTTWVSEARAAGLWSRAMTLELLSADDPPTYARAWALYRDAPVELAPDLLEDIKDARKDALDEKAGDGK